MTALQQHLDGDCWWPCYYCMAEDAADESEETE